MHKLLFSLVFVLLTIWTNQVLAKEELKYPSFQTVNHIDKYGTVKVQDPYNSFEDLSSKETKKWIKEENKTTKQYFKNKIGSQEVDAIKKELTDISNYPKFGTPRVYNDKYFFLYNPGTKNQFCLYQSDNLSFLKNKDESQIKKIVDPNNINSDGTATISNWQVSDDANYLAYGISKVGSDWQEWHVKDLNTNKDLKDDLKWIKYNNVEWTKDCKGFYYTRFDEPSSAKAYEEANYFHKVYYHKLNTEQKDDELIYQNKKDKTWYFTPKISHDGRYLILTIVEGDASTNRLYIMDLEHKNLGFKKLFDKPDAKYDYIGNLNNNFYINTNIQNPRGKVIAVDINNPKVQKIVIPQSDSAITDCYLIKDRLLVNAIKDAHSKITIYNLRGKLVSTPKLPGLGMVYNIFSKQNSPIGFFSYTSYNYQPQIFSINIEKPLSVENLQQVDNKSDYIVKQVFYPSKDKTMIPMYLCYKKDLKITNDCPVLLYGYGGFDISILPYYKPMAIQFMNMGGIYAVANLRGGGEYGESWHQAGMKSKKQNVFDDFIYAAKYLIAHNYTNQSKLAINGASNGGLLVGACMVQQPDLFQVALPQVGVMDMLKFQNCTEGWAWMCEYGNSKIPSDFSYLYKYSPYHNIKAKTCYPATLITTGDHDDRVVPWHSFKFAAKLQASQACDNPILIRIETNAGHGAGKPLSKQIDEMADQIAFLKINLHI